MLNCEAAALPTAALFRRFRPDQLLLRGRYGRPSRWRRSSAG